jgi:hypothetical protein
MQIPLRVAAWIDPHARQIVVVGVPAARLETGAAKNLLSPFDAQTIRIPLIAGANTAPARAGAAWLAIDGAEAAKESIHGCNTNLPNNRPSHVSLGLRFLNLI